MDLSQFKHKIPVQVRFVDIDKLGHVNNAVYLSYFEMARVNYFDELVGERVNWYTTGMILGRSVVDYKMPVFLDDKLFVYTAVTRFGTKSFDISNILVKVKEGKEEIASTATFTIVCYNYESKSTIEIPTEWKKQMEEFEGTKN
jgi:acyl-CoA thioester hydrolase